MKITVYATLLPLLAGALALQGAETLIANGELHAASAGKMDFTQEFISVKPNMALQLSGKAVGPSESTAQVGIMFYNINKGQIRPHMVNAIPGTETTLVKDAQKGDTALTVTDASKWKSLQFAKILIFNAKPDCSDLPNGAAEFYITKVEKQGENWLVTLDRPLSRNYAAGVMVRQHCDGGWMNFGVGGVDASMEGTPFKMTALAAKPGEPIAVRVWPGAAYAKIYCIPSTELMLQELQLTALTEDETRDIEACRVLEGADLKGKVNTFNAKKTLKRPDFLAMEAGSKFCGFYQMNLAWKAEEIKQVEFTVRTTAPGYFRFSYTAKVNGTAIQTPSNLQNTTVQPDGEWHTIVFDVANDPRWQGTITNWELGWTGDAGTLELKKVSAPAIRNQIPDAANADLTKPISLDLLMPRTRCTLSWEGGNAPAMTITGVDYNLHPLPDWQVTLPAGEKSVSFTVPETLVSGVLTVKTPGKGFPVLVQEDEYRHPFTVPSNWRGQWIWSQREWGPFDASVWFEKTFELESVPEFASAAFLADDKSWVYVNGELIGTTTAFSVAGYSVITPYLKKGVNRITVRVYNGTQNAGLVFNGYLQFKDHETCVDSDATWLCDPESNVTQRFPDRIDRPVVELGSPNTTKPWANLINFRNAGRCGRLDCTEFAPGTIKAKVLELPTLTVKRINLRLTADNGQVRKVSVPVTPASSEWRKGEEIELHYSVPRWTGQGYELTVDDDFVALFGKTRVKVPEIKHAIPEIRQAKLLNVGTRPVIQLGGRTVNPVFWHLIAAIRRDQWFECDVTREYGFENYRIFTDFIEFWKSEDQYDFSKLDQDLDLLFTAHPDAVLAVQVYANMPNWWLKAHPDSESVHYNGAPRQLDRDKQALGSKEWLQGSEAPIRALIAHLKQSPYADRIWGMNFSENGNGEWFWWAQDRDHNPSVNGYSKSDYAAFRNLLREKYGTDEALAKAWNQPGVTFATAMMPDPAKVDQGRIGTLLDPVKDAQLIDWYIFRNRALAEAIIYFCRIAKEETGGKWLTGAYYGYFTELIENGYWRLQQAGHNGFWEVAQSPYVDFVHGPSRYNYRRVGMSDQIMQTWDTFLLHGKTVYCEQDMRTVFSPPQGDANRIYLGIPATTLQSVGQLNRALGMALATGTNLYYFDLSSGGLIEKITLQVMGEQLKVIQELPPVQGLTPVEVAIVGDRDSAYMVKGAAADGVFTGAVSGLFKRFNELAAPYHSLVIGDLLDPAITVPPHKLYVMLPTLLLSQAQREALLKRFEAEKASVVWLYAAGPDDPETGFSAAHNADFLGIQTALEEKSGRPAIQMIPEWGSLSGENYNETSPWFYPVSGYDAVLGRDAEKRPVLVVKQQRGATHYLATLTNLPVEFYGMLMDKNGIHRYVKGRDPVWVGNDVLFLTATSGGEKRLNLPSGVKARGIIGPFRGTVTDQQPFTAVAGMTYGFLLEK